MLSVTVVPTCWQLDDAATVIAAWQSDTFVQFLAAVYGDVRKLSTGMSGRCPSGALGVRSERLGSSGP